MMSTYIKESTSFEKQGDCVMRTIRLTLVGLSAALYAIHYFIFEDPYHILTLELRQSCIATDSRPVGSLIILWTSS